MILSAALDLGTTRIKAALLTEEGALDRVRSLPAPPLSGEGLIRESDPAAYLRGAREILSETLDREGPRTVVGIAAQRSSFLLWEKVSGRPLTPLISWQDRRALAWCEARREGAARVTEMTGLPLSPHYAGPKLASLLEQDRGLKKMAGRGEALFGTLDSWLIRHLTASRRHVTDLSMAARTLLADIDTGGWSDRLLDFFGVPSALLPAIVSTWGREDELSDGGLLTASLADQGAALLALPRRGSGSILVNLGTGGFVIRPVGGRPERPKGYLAGPAAAGPGGEGFYFLEGTVNGIASAVEHLERTPSLPVTDPTPDLYCVPDTAGIGAPYWLAGEGPLFSKPLESIDSSAMARIVREGIVFRICQIIEELEGGRTPGGCFVSGGLSDDDFIVRGIASCQDRDVAVLRERDATLLGAGLLAAGEEASAAASRKVPPPDSYLGRKFLGWKEWVRGRL